MSLFVLDTDALSLWQHGHPAVTHQISAHAAHELTITVITVQEQLDGWHLRLARARDKKQLADLYRRLIDAVHFLSRLKILPFPEAAIDRYEELKKQKLNIGKMDLRIASIVLECGATLVTRNLQDFGRIPGLTIEDWTK
jgi:tRNA(fMet)-specific endonuclease VapC